MSRVRDAARLSAAACLGCVRDLYRLAELLKLLDVGGGDRLARRQHGRIEVAEVDLAAAGCRWDARLAVVDVLADGELGRALAHLVRVGLWVRVTVISRGWGWGSVGGGRGVTSVMSAPEKPSVRSARLSRSTSAASGDLRVQDSKIILVRVRVRGRGRVRVRVS